MGKVTRRGFVGALVGLVAARPVVNVLPAATGDITKATFKYWQPTGAQISFAHLYGVGDHRLDALRYSIMTQMEADDKFLALIRRKAAADQGITS